MWILASYNGADSLDLTWDNTISHLINAPLYEKGVRLISSSVNLIAAQPEVNDEKISYSLKFINISTGFATDWIVRSLKEAGYERGMCIKEVDSNGQEKVMHVEAECADIQLRRQSRKGRKKE